MQCKLRIDDIKILLIALLKQFFDCYFNVLSLQCTFCKAKLQNL